MRRLDICCAIETLFTERHLAGRPPELGINEVTTAPRSPWQNQYAEWVVDFICRKCLDHMIIPGEHHLKRVPSGYVDYYHSARTHLSLEKDAPDGRVVQPIEKGRVVDLQQVGGCTICTREWLPDGYDD